MLKIEKRLSLAAGLLLLFLGLAPIFLYCVINTGVFALIIMGVLLLIFSALIEKPRYLFLCRLIALTVLPFLAGGAVLTGIMLANSAEQPPPQDSVLMIMGAGVQSGGPSAMLKSRLDRALEYIVKHPDTTIVVTGGVTSPGAPSEAGVMENYLIAAGVDRRQIIFESRAQNTKENMLFSAEILNQNGIHTKNVITVTNGFHQFRTKIYAGRAGLTTYPLNCGTPLLLIPCSWTREWIAILATFLR